MTEDKKHSPSRMAITGYVLWFLLLTRLLYVAIGNTTPNFAEAFGVHVGLGLGLLAFLGIPYLIEKYRTKNSERAISWLFIMVGTTIIALLLCIGGLYGRVNSNTKPVQPPTDLSVVNQQKPAVVQAKPAAATVPTPVTFEQCNQLQTSQSQVANVELWQDFCRLAFDTTKHPVARARDLCVVMTWADPGKNPDSAMTECELKNPLPACPESLQFDLYNMRCEVTCDKQHGYAPDASGKSCYLACPDGSWPLYAGTVKRCG